MSTEAVTWAMDDAPMLRTGAGRPDTTARHVLQVVAEHASKTGRNAHPSAARIEYRTGYDRRTVQRALRRLEDAGLLIRDGSVGGRTRWRLAMDQRRPESDWAELEAEEAAGRADAAERKRRSRAKGVTHSESVTVTHSGDVTTGDVTHSASVGHALEVRDKADVTHSASVGHALSAALTTNQPSDKLTVLQPENGSLLESAGGQPDFALPLIHLIHGHGLAGLRWNLAPNEWLLLEALIRAKGIEAMADYAARAGRSSTRPVVSARYFLKGWREVPNQPPNGTARPSLRPVPAAEESTGTQRARAAVEAGRQLQAMIDRGEASL